MASRKNLKKTVNFIVEEIVTDCLVQQALKDTDENKVDEVLADVLSLQNEFLSRANHTEPNNVKAFYKDFYADFNAGVDAIYAKIEAF
ncbi:MAG: hypothetical protein IKH59_05960 [Bacteroidaceae bacterium]|nr:hypothetical protein [Bacteroidaceae bacterium]